MTGDREDIVLHHADILELIPHRYPFLLIDRVEQIVADVSARGVKAITNTEPHLQGHFPGHPIMPGVLTIEAMAQTAAVMMAYSNPEASKGKHVYFTGIDKVKFRAPARPGHILYLDVVITAHKGALFKFDGTASIEDKKVATASFAAMIVEPGQ